MNESRSPADGLDRFAWRASLLFAGLVVVDFFVIVTTLAKPDLPMVARVLYGLAPVAWSVLAVVLIIGLAWRTWAIPASIVVLLGLIVAGAVMTIIELSQGRLHFPIGLILALIVMRSLPRGTPYWAQDRVARLAVVGALLVVAFVNAWPLGVDALLRPGASPLSVGPEALAMEVEVECVAPPSAGEPMTATARITWRWGSSEWFVDGRDTLVMSWYASGSPEEVSYATLDGYEAYGAGIGLREADRGFGSVTFEVDAQSGSPNQGGLDLELLGDSRPHGVLVVQASYSHLDRWTARSEEASCYW